MLQIYCGDGKGKTTAALGLAVRAAAYGMQVHFVQFLKGRPSSELLILEQIPRITVLRCDKDYGFTFQMNDEDKSKITNCHNRMLSQAMDKVYQGGTDLLVLDEFFAAYNCNLFDRELANRLVFGIHDRTELILTGRDPEQKFIDLADYVSEIKSLKHPYEKGISARPGIEY